MKFINTICNICIAIVFVVIWGIAGASDLNTMSISRILLDLFYCTTLILVFCLIKFMIWRRK